jgi:hypothetical protein
MAQKVRVCPKCKHENPATSTACEECKELIFEVPFTDSSRETASTGAGGSMPGGAIGYNPPARQEVKSGGSPVVWVMVLIVLAALGAGGWWFFTKSLPPDQVVQKLCDPAYNGSYDKMKPYLSKSSISMIVAQFGSEEKAAKEMGYSLKKMGAAADQKLETGKVTYEGNGTALVEIVPPKEQAGQMKQLFGNDMKFVIVTIKEDNAWKIDLPQTSAKMQTQLMNAIQKKMGGRMPMPTGKGL